MNFEQYFFIFNENKKLTLTDLLINHLKTLKLIIAFRFENDRTILSRTDYYSTLEELQSFYTENKDFLEIIDTGNNKISFETVVSEITDWQEREKLEYQNRRNGILPAKYQNLTLEKIKEIEEKNKGNFGFITSTSDLAKVGKDIRREFRTSALSVPFELEENGKIVIMDKYFIQITFDDFVNKYNILKTDGAEEVFKKMNIRYNIKRFERTDEKRISCIFEKKENYINYTRDTIIDPNSINFEKTLLEYLGWYVVFVENQNKEYISVANDIFNFWDKKPVVTEFYDLLLEYLDKYKQD